MCVCVCSLLCFFIKFFLPSHSADSPFFLFILFNFIYICFLKKYFSPLPTLSLSCPFHFISRIDLKNSLIKRIHILWTQNICNFIVQFLKIAISFALPPPSNPFICLFHAQCQTTSPIIHHFHRIFPVLYISIVTFKTSLKLLSCDSQQHRLHNFNCDCEIDKSDKMLYFNLTAFSTD